MSSTPTIKTIAEDPARGEGIGSIGNGCSKDRNVPFRKPLPGPRTKEEPMSAKYSVILNQDPAAGMQAIITAQGERPRYVADFSTAIEWIRRQTEMERRLTESIRRVVQTEIRSSNH